MDGRLTLDVGGGEVVGGIAHGAELCSGLLDLVLLGTDCLQ